MATETQFDIYMSEECEVILTRKQIEFVVGKSVDFKNQMWNNGCPLPGYDFALELCQELFKQYPEHIAQKYTTI